MHFINVKDIHKKYNAKSVVSALDGITMEVKKGELLAIVGPSGSGKTTFLNLVGAIDRPTSGDIYFEDTRITGLSKSKLAEFRLHKIGFVFQAYNLIGVLTVEENIEFVLKLQGMKTAEIKKRVGSAIESLGLRDYTKCRPSDISYGEQQRVAVARAIVSEPMCVLADEPTASLDSATGKAVVDLMRKINQKRGITIIIATHDLPIIQQCDRIVEIRDGKILDG